jgi:hypothetical protein
LPIFVFMKKVLLLLTFSTLILSLQGQHPLVGTWEMISISGINADGQNFFLDTSTVKETKIITASNYILIARDKENGSWLFNRCYVGSAKIDGNQYFETPLLSSLRIFENVTTDFRWKLEGDRFIQSGTITRPDGKTIILKEFIFRRITDVSANGNASFTGTWQLIDQNGRKGFLIITPTHWMGILKSRDQFEKAFGGHHKITGNSAELFMDYTSGSGLKEKKSVQLKGGKLHLDDFVFEKTFE